jgi:transposase-like protein
MSAQKYTEDKKAEVLAYYAATQNNLAKTAAAYKIPKQTIHYWVKGGAVNESVSQSSDIKKGALADRLEELAHLLVEAIPNKIDEASLQQVATSLGIAVDKMQLLRSKPTEIIEDASLSNTERAARITTLLNNARTRGVGLAAGSTKVATA